MDRNARRRTGLSPAPPGRVAGAVLVVLAAVLAALAAQARAVMASETLPDHVSMATGADAEVRGTGRPQWQGRE